MHYPQITGTQKNFVFDWIVQKNRKCLHDGRHTHTHTSKQTASTAGTSMILLFILQINGTSSSIRAM